MLMLHALREIAVSMIRRSASAQRTEDELESTRAVLESCSQEIRKHREHDQHDRQCRIAGSMGGMINHLLQKRSRSP